MKMEDELQAVRKEWKFTRSRRLVDPQGLVSSHGSLRLTPRHTTGTQNQKALLNNATKSMDMSVGGRLRISPLRPPYIPEIVGVNPIGATNAEMRSWLGWHRRPRVASSGPSQLHEKIGRPSKILGNGIVAHGNGRVRLPARSLDVAACSTQADRGNRFAKPAQQQEPKA